MKTRHMSPGLVAAKTGEAGRQLVTRGRAEWFEPGREQFRAVEAGPHEPCRLMAFVSREIVPYLVGRDPPDDPGSLAHLHPRRLCRPRLAHELADGTDRYRQLRFWDAADETNRAEST